MHKDSFSSHPSHFVVGVVYQIRVLAPTAREAETVARRLVEESLALTGVSGDFLDTKYIKEV